MYKDDRSKLHKKGFNTTNQIDYEDDEYNDVEDRNDGYYELFKEMPVNMLTTQQGTKEWHMCRSFSFTSSTMLELMSVLDRHNVDWPEYKEVQRFYSKRAANDATHT